jgi:polynucleotide 5'-kinase involved in rRNA processing
LLVSLTRGLANSVDVTFVNTDGWIGDPAALRFKDELIRAVQADLVLGLGEGKEVDSLLNVVSSTSIRLSSSKYARTRSKEERKRAREAGYRRFLLGASPVSVNQGGISLRMFDRPQQTLLRWNTAFKGFLTGLLDADERLLGIGRIREISDRDAVVETKAGQMPRFLEIGNILLSSKYEETGYGILH